MATLRQSFITCLSTVVALLSLATTSDAKYTSATPPVTGPTVPGNRAVVKNGIAYAPENAPDAVKRAIWATNYLTHKPYVWGGGHGSFYEDGYDCSGSVSFLLKHAGKLSSPCASGELTRYGENGAGRWITVYAKNGHVYAVVAGLRLDTTANNGSDEGPRWRRDQRPSWGFTARHPEGL